MKRFFYKAKDKKGNLVTGEVEAASLPQAARLIRSRGLLVISIRPIVESPFSLLKKIKERVGPGEVAMFTRQMATMINAGLSIAEALVILRSQSKSIFQKIVTQVLAEVEGGQSLSSSLSKYPKVFSPTYVALIKAGEAGGVMDKVLLRLADNMEKQQEFKGKVKGALIYPAIIVVGMLVVGMVMMIFVVPRLTSLYSEFNAQLPLPTRILMGFSNLLIKLWPLLLIVVFFGFYGFSLYRKTKLGRRKTDELIYKIPIIGPLQRQVALTEISRTLSLMVGSGVSILEALNITSEVAGNVIISEALKDAAKQVEKGFPVAFSFAKHPEAFPYLLSQMVAVGEETGKMDEVLEKISHIFEMESDQKVKALTSAIEPLVMIILGLGVGFLVIAIILPIYNLTSQF